MQNSLKTQSYLFSRTIQPETINVEKSHQSQMDPAMQMMATMQATPENKQWQQGDYTFVTLRVKTRQGRYVLKIFRVVNSETGNIYVYVRDPTRGMDEKKRRGEVCPECGHGILLNEEQMRGKPSMCKYAVLSLFSIVPIFWPCLLGYFCYDCDKRTCTNCKEVFKGEGCRRNFHHRKF